MKYGKVAIIKVRCAQDVGIDIPAGALNILSLVGGSAMKSHLDASHGLAVLPNMALPYLAALCMKHDDATGSTREYVLIDESEENLKRWDWSVDLAMFSVSTTCAVDSYRVADLARSWGVKVVMGGIHPSMLPEEAAAHADSVAIGEAETIIGTILDDFDSGKLNSRYEGGRAASLDNLPVPAWELGLMRIVDDRSGPAGSVRPYAPWVVPVQTSRGCRNACAFCSTTRYQGAARRHRPVADIVAEIRALQANGTITKSHTVFFTDNNIVSDTDHHRGARDTAYAESLFNALIPLGITWVGQGEITVGEDPGLVDLMARAGCHTLLIGMETISQKYLRGIGKASMNVERYANCLETLHDHGISNIGCFIMGLDGQGPDAFAATREFIKRHVDIPQVSIMTPYPGTALHRKLDSEGRILSRDWSMYDITHVVFSPDTMTPAELEHQYSLMVSDIYSLENVIGRSLRYAVRRTVNGMPAFGITTRFTSVFVPNIAYRALSKIRRGLPVDVYSGRGTRPKSDPMSGPVSGPGSDDKLRPGRPGFQQAPMRVFPVPSGASGMGAGWALATRSA